MLNYEYIRVLKTGYKNMLVVKRNFLDHQDMSVFHICHLLVIRLQNGGLAVGGRDNLFIISISYPQIKDKLRVGMRYCSDGCVCVHAPAPGGLHEK